MLQRPIHENTANLATLGLAHSLSARPYRVSRFNVALDASAAGLSALNPTAPIDHTAPRRSHKSSNSSEVYWAPWSEWSTVPAKAPVLAPGGLKRIGYQFGAHVVGDRPAHQAA